jgi:hypothetical protein
LTIREREKQGEEAAKKVPSKYPRIELGRREVSLLCRIDVNEKWSSDSKQPGSDPVAYRSQREMARQFFNVGVNASCWLNQKFFLGLTWVAATLCSTHLAQSDAGTMAVTR